MELSNAPDQVLEALAKAAMVRNPLGPVYAAMALSVNAEAHLTPEQAERWNRAIERAWGSLSNTRTELNPVDPNPSIPEICDS
jgi:hypothetical protein